MGAQVRRIRLCGKSVSCVRLYILVRLPRLIGQSRALDMILTGRPVHAKEALEFGLANRLAPNGHARKMAEQLAQDLAKLPQACMLSDRASVYKQFGHSEQDALKVEFEGSKDIVNSAMVSTLQKFSGQNSKNKK
jgi:enoyl-CoA hydratase